MEGNRGRSSNSPSMGRYNYEISHEMNFADRLGAMSQIYMQVQPQPYGKRLPGHMPFRWDGVNNIHTSSSHSRNHNTINSICWNKTGTHFITGGRDSVLRLYSCDNDMKKSTDFKGHTNSVNFVAFDNPESENMFASVSEDQSFRVWDTRKKTPVHVERTKEKLLRGMFCPVVEGDKGNIFATCNYEDDLNFYDTRMWKLKSQIKYKTEVNSFMWDWGASAFIVADISGNISIYNAQTLKPQPEAVLSGIHRKTKCECLAMHPSNEFFVSGGYDSLIAFWDFEDLICSGTISENNF